MFEKFLFRKIEAWILIAAMLLALIAVPLFGWLLHYQITDGRRGGVLGELALQISMLPDPIVRILLGQNILEPQVFEAPNAKTLTRVDPTFQDDGIILVSGYSKEYGVSTAYLYDLKEEKILHRWLPPLEDIAKQTTMQNKENERIHFGTQHPFLMPNGDMLFTSGDGPLAKIDKCSSLIWSIDKIFHHSIEMGSDGTLYVPSVLNPSDTSNGYSYSEEHKVNPLRDDTVAKVRLDGTVVSEWSVRSMLERHGYGWLLYGVGKFEPDRIHLNDVQPILVTDDYVREGDLLLSLRNLSTVLLYRPAEDRIVWLKTGPWLNQHDVDYQQDGVFTVFGNDTIRGPFEGISLNGYSTIWAYDDKSKQTYPLLEMTNPNIYSEAQGLHRVLDNGDVFVEAEDNRKLVRLNKSGIRWVYQNVVAPDQIGMLHWSRYFARDELDLSWLKQDSCSPEAGNE